MLVACSKFELLGERSFDGGHELLKMVVIVSRGCLELHALTYEEDHLVWQSGY